MLDHVFQLPKIPKFPVKSFASNYFQAGGGNAATAAVALKRAGGQAVFWGRLGDDHNGDLILDELEEFGVDVRDVLRQQGVKSGVSSVLVDDAGERLITNYSDPKLNSDANWLPLERLKESNALVKVEPMTFSLLDAEGEPVASVTNYPLSLAYSTTIHKAQGMTLDGAIINLKSLWEPGQAYVALSRVKDPKSLYIEDWSASSIKTDPMVMKFYEHVKAYLEQLLETTSTNNSVEI